MITNGFIEQKPYLITDLASSLGLSACLDDARDILDHLLLAGVAKPYQEGRPDDWIDESIHGEYLAYRKNDNQRFKFVYVGIIEINGHVIKCFPKFIKHDPNIEDMRSVLNATERYNAEHTTLETSLANSQGRIPNQLALALTLIRDYLTYGLYSNQRDELTLHGQGDIDWEATINTTMPTFRDNRPYYFDYYTNDTVQDDTDYITRLHACIVSECSNRLHECELDEILQLETPTPYQGDRIDFGTDEYIIQRLRKEMNVQFVSRKQTILSSLLAWIEHTSLETNSSGIQMFGTNSFHTLWEAMCAEVFENQFTHKLKSLGITLANTDNEDDTLESLIKKPQWKARIGGHVHNAEKTLRPDYISIVRDAVHTHFVILDAKYYNIELDDRHVCGQPGVEDVSKQYLYHLAYKDFIEEHGMTSINAFISPTDQTESSVVGTAEMPIFSDLKLPAIQVVKLSASKILNNYNSHTHLLLQEEVPALFSDAATHKTES